MAGACPGRYRRKALLRSRLRDHPAALGRPGACRAQNLRTQWETTQAAQFTSDTEEYAYTAAVDQLSDRVRVVEIGRTVLGRPINMFVVGYPAPPSTAAAVAATSPLAINCNVHGNEPGNRESCLILVRRLAFATDARTIDLLTQHHGPHRPDDQR